MLRCFKCLFQIFVPFVKSIVNFVLGINILKTVTNGRFFLNKKVQFPPVDGINTKHTKSVAGFADRTGTPVGKPGWPTK